jgi:hypothetical protein
MTEESASRLGVALAAIGIASLLALVLHLRLAADRAERERADLTAQASPAPGPSEAAVAPSPAPQGPRPRLQTRVADHDARWAAFTERFGAELRAELGPGGRVTAIRGARGHGAQAGASFNSTDPQATIARAREILKAAGDLLGLRSDCPLGEPVYRGDATSADVYFRETHDGLPLSPYGQISIKLGPQGELVDLGSSYVPGVEETNQTKLSEDDARRVALGTSGGETRAEGGQQILWSGTPASDSGLVSARRAYDFVFHGHEVVVDAQTGAVIMSRDRRTF